MTPEEIGRLLDEIGERIGPAGEYAWAAAVRWTAIQAWFTIGLWLAITLAGVVLFLQYRKVDDWDHPNAPGIASITGGMLLFFSFLGAAMYGADAAARALVPEWGAIQQLLP